MFCLQPGRKLICNLLSRLAWLSIVLYHNEGKKGKKNWAHSSLNGEGPESQQEMDPKTLTLMLIVEQLSCFFINFPKVNFITKQKEIRCHRAEPFEWLSLVVEMKISAL